MKRARFSEEQIIGVLKEAEGGADELGHRAHRLVSRPEAGRRDATRSSLGSKTSQFFDRPSSREGRPEKLG
jgi:hypothetical protein